MTTLLSAIETHLYETGLAPSAFSRKVYGNSQLLNKLRDGRSPKAETVSRIRLLIESYTPTQRDRPWCPDMDAQLFTMVEAGDARRLIAFRLGTSLAAVHDRINLLADDWYPARPYGLWISRFRARRMHRDPISKTRPRFWTEKRDVDLLRMVEGGKPDSELGALVGVSPEAARQRVNKVAARYFPDKPARMTMTEYLFAFRVWP